MRKIIFGYWFYTIGIIIFILAGLGLSLLIIALGIVYPEDYIASQFIGWIILVIMLLSGTVFLVVIAGSQIIQFVVVSEKGIKIRAPFRTIRALEWSEVKEVRHEKFYVSVHGGFSTGWYVFDDGMERKQYSGFVSKKSHITVHASKRARKIIEAFWHEPIIER